MKAGDADESSAILASVLQAGDDGGIADSDVEEFLRLYDQVCSCPCLFHLPPPPPPFLFLLLAAISSLPPLQRLLSLSLFSVSTFVPCPVLGRPETVGWSE